MSDAQQKIDKIKEVLDRLENEVMEMRRILKSENMSELCLDCVSWVGRCLKNHLNRTANSQKCEGFKNAREEVKV